MESVRTFLHVDAFVDGVRSLTWAKLLLVALAVVMVISGNAGQLISLNLWVIHMGTIPPPSTPLSILTISATTMAVGFLTAIGIRKVIFGRRISLMFLMSTKAVVLSLIIGMCNALNGVLLVYATPATQEIMQALLLCTQVFWTLIASKICLNDRRSILNVLVIGSFLCVAGGIILGASPQFSQNDPTTSDTKYWTLIFAASMIPGALYNVFASMYMRAFTRLSMPEEPSKTTSLLMNGVDEPVDSSRSDDTTVKLTMLATTGISQMVWMFVLMPMDAAPWFGSSPDIAVTRQNLANGWSCVFKGAHECATTEAYRYYILFNVSYFVNYVGSAYLNHFSATLNSMVTQLSAPIAAIVLLIAPSLNVNEQAVAIGQSIGGIVLLVIGSVVFTLWEQGTRHKAHEAPPVVIAYRVDSAL